MELYQNINPQPYDDTTKPVVTLQPAETKSVRLLESREKKLGEVFYIRYYVQLPGSEYSEKEAVFLKAGTNTDYVQFIVDKDQTINIPQPKTLTFMQAVLKLQNTGTHPINVLRGTLFLPNLGTNENLLLEPGQVGFYELKFSDIVKLTHSSGSVEEKVSNIVFQNAERQLDDYTMKISVPEFTIKQGHIYSFKWNGENIAIDEPVVAAIGSN
ncbi:MAG: hypothetical protein P1P63_05305 [Treponemataceae bacterium]